MAEGLLKATTRRLDHEIDLIDAAGRSGVLFTRSGCGLAGRGVAWRGPAALAGEVLAEIECDDEVGRSGCGPVAFGALPFDPGAKGELIIPALIVGKVEDGTRWITAVGTRGDEPDLVLEPEPDTEPGVSPSRFDVGPTTDPHEWCASVAKATSLIREGELEKVVLAREIVVTADQEFDPTALLRRLRSAYPECYLYSVDGYVGASPELLVGRHGDIVRAQPMAGTTARRGDPGADARAAAALLASASYRHEHQVTIDMVHDTLLPFCSYLDYEPEPSVVALANVSHLATKVEGRLSQPAAKVSELVQALHPTPAVCGRPRHAALRVISMLEDFDRGPYGGPIGWLDRDGNGEWAVAIRGALLQGATARVYAGNGIVAGSDPQRELAETRAKLGALLGALVQP